MLTSISETSRKGRNTTSTKKKANNYGTPYDFGSFMHYFGYARIKTNVPHKQYENDLETMGSPFTSFYDILLINKHYGCLDKCESKRSAAKCKMGGYPNLRDCSKCICPRGYGGASCNERPQAKKCGETLTASSKANIIACAVGNILNMKEMEDFEECYYWIQLRIWIVKFADMPYAGYYTSLASDCSTGEIEIKAQKDQLLSGYRFCDPDANEGKTITSSNDIVPVIIYNRQGELKSSWNIEQTDEEA